MSGFHTQIEATVLDLGDNEYRAEACDGSCLIEGSCEDLMSVGIVFPHDPTDTEPDTTDEQVPE